MAPVGTKPPPCGFLSPPTCSSSCPTAPPRYHQGSERYQCRATAHPPSSSETFPSVSDQYPQSNRPAKPSGLVHCTVSSPCGPNSGPASRTLVPPQADETYISPPSKEREMATLFNDIQYGLRTMRKSKGFTAVAVLTMAVGIAANTTVFSWIDATLLHPFPGVGDPARIVALETLAPSGEHITASYPDYRDLRDRTKLLDGITVTQPGL